jgi:1-acyl-sn-glycerol-3-phosphate acyltransferase
MTIGTVARRAVVLPIVLAVEALILATAPILLAVAAVVSIPISRRAPLRATAAVVCYAAIELSALAESTRARDASAYDEIVARFVRRLETIAARVLGTRLVLSSDSADLTGRPPDRPLVVLSRHAGPGDSLLVLGLLSTRWQLRPRVVLRSALRLEPTVDLVLARLPTCFVRRRRPEQARTGVARVAAGLRAGDALLIFPEGGNFSTERRRNRIVRLRRRREYAAARRARRMRHVVAPHPGGVLAALDAAPTADVVVLAHEGLAPPGADRRPWWSLPLDRDVAAFAWHIARRDVPDTDEAREKWLYEQWERVDRWVRAAEADRQSFSIGA